MPLAQPNRWTQVLREARGSGLAALRLTPAALGELIALIDAGTISGKIAKELFAELLAHGGSAKALVAARAPCSWRSSNGANCCRPI